MNPRDIIQPGDEEIVTEVKRTRGLRNRAVNRKKERKEDVESKQKKGRRKLLL